jgi:hypothetical protein
VVGGCRDRRSSAIANGSSYVHILMQCEGSRSRPIWVGGNGSKREREVDGWLSVYLSMTWQVARELRTCQSLSGTHM